MVDRVKRRIQRKKTGVPPTAQQDVDVRETVVDLEPHPDAPDQTKTGSFKAIEDSDLIGEEIETGIATEEGADILMDKDDAPSRFCASSTASPTRVSGRAFPR